MQCSNQADTSQDGKGEVLQIPACTLLGSCLLELTGLAGACGFRDTSTFCCFPPAVAAETLAGTVWLLVWGTLAHGPLQQKQTALEVFP